MPHPPRCAPFSLFGVCGQGRRRAPSTHPPGSPAHPGPLLSARPAFEDEAVQAVRGARGRSAPGGGEGAEPLGMGRVGAAGARKSAGKVRRMRDVGAGFGYLIQGQRWVARHGKQYGFGLLPGLITLVLYAAALVTLALYGEDFVTWSTPFADDWSSPWLGLF